MAGSIDETGSIATVNIDYVQAAYEAIQCLVDTGHQRIAFVTGPLSCTINTHKPEAYKSQQTQCIVVDEPYCMEEDSYDGGIADWATLSQLNNPPTAFSLVVTKLLLALFKQQR